MSSPRIAFSLDATSTLLPESMPFSIVSLQYGTVRSMQSFRLSVRGSLRCSTSLPEVMDRTRDSRIEMGQSCTCRT